MQRHRLTLFSYRVQNSISTSGVAEILNKPSLATVATSGSYNDLSNKPTIDTSVTSGSNNAVSSNAVACCGSQEILDGPDGNTWYNFIYIPHRNGVGGDNYQYGSLLLFNMVANTNNMWICHLVRTNWYPPQKINS